MSFCWSCWVLDCQLHNYHDHLSVSAVIREGKESSGQRSLKLTFETLFSGNYSLSVKHVNETAWMDGTSKPAPMKSVFHWRQLIISRSFMPWLQMWISWEMVTKSVRMISIPAHQITLNVNSRILNIALEGKTAGAINWNQRQTVLEVLNRDVASSSCSSSLSGRHWSNVVKSS